MLINLDLIVYGSNERPRKRFTWIRSDRFDCVLEHETTMTEMHSAAVLRSNAVFRSSSTAVLCPTNVEGRAVISNVTSTIHRKMYPGEVTSTTTAVGWQHPYIPATSHDSCKALTTTKTTTSGQELDGTSTSDSRRRTCAACGQDIVDRFLLHAIDRYWHNGCLRCSSCQAALAELGSTCFIRAGMILCRNDYIR